MATETQHPQGAFPDPNTPTGGQPSQPPQQGMKMTPVDWDWITGFPFPTIDFILNRFLPQYMLESRDFTGQKGEVKGIISSAVERESEFTIVSCGDVLNVPYIPPVNITKNEALQGECYLPPHEIQLFVTSEKYDILRNVVVEQVSAEKGLCRMKSKLSGKVIIWNDLKDIHDALKKNLEPIKGPLEKHQVCVSSRICVKVDDWPGDKEGLFKRSEDHHKWPPREVIKDIVSHGCYVTPDPNIGTPPGDSPVMWKYCFPEAEHKIISCLNKSQLQCLALLLLVHQDQLHLPNIITKEHVQSQFLWLCEKLGPGYWVQENMGQCLLGVIDLLFHATISAELPNFYNPKINMLKGISPDHLEDMQKKLSHLRQDLPKVLLKFAESKRMSYWPDLMDFTDLCYIMTKLEEDPEINQSDVDTAYLRAMKLWCLGYVAELKFEAALEYGKEVETWIMKKHEEKYPAIQLLVSIVDLLKDVDVIIALMEFVCDKTPEDSPMHHANVGNLACFYHSKAADMAEGEDKNKINAKAKETFTKAINLPTASPATFVDFGNFLVNIHEYKEAIPHLKRAIQDKSRESGNSYSETEKNTLSSDLQLYINSGQNVVLPSRIYAFYLLVLCYLQVEPQAVTDELMAEFNAACEEFTQTSQIYAVYGLALKAAQQDDMAQAAFLQAHELNPDDVIVKTYSTLL